MELRPSWEVYVSSASKVIPRILRNPSVHHLAHESPATGLHPKLDKYIHILKHQFLKIHFNIILSPTSRSSKRTLFFRVSNQILQAFLASLMRAYATPIATSFNLITSSDTKGCYHKGYDLGWMWYKTKLFSVNVNYSDLPQLHTRTPAANTLQRIYITSLRNLRRQSQKKKPCILYWS